MIHTLAQAEAALRAAHARSLHVTLRSAPGAANYAGLDFLKPLFETAARSNPEAKHNVIIDCGSDPALAHRAMVMGFQRITFSGPSAMAEKIAQIGKKCGARLVPTRTPAHVLDLLDSPHPENACETYLDQRRAQQTKKKTNL